MSFQITETGLVVSGPLSDQEHDQVCEFLKRAELGMQWAWGDWYLTIPEGDKQKHCEDRGVNWKHISKCARVANLFPGDLRRSLPSFKHGVVLSLEDLNKTQRDKLIRKANRGDIKEKKDGTRINVPWSATKLQKERDLLLGKVPEPDGPPVEDALEAVLEELPKSASNKVKKGIKEEFMHLQASFNDEVEKRVNARMQEERRQLRELRQQLEGERERLMKASLKIDGLLTKSQYQKIRSVIHPDKQPTDRQKTEAFQIFSKLAESVNPNATRWN